MGKYQNIACKFYQILLGNKKRFYSLKIASDPRLGL